MRSTAELCESSAVTWGQGGGGRGQLVQTRDLPQRHQPQREGEDNASQQWGVLPACGGKMPVRVFWRIASALSPNGDVCALSLPSVDGGCSCSFEAIRAPSLETGDRLQKGSLAGMSHNQHSGNAARTTAVQEGAHAAGPSPPGLLVCDKGHRPLGRVPPMWESLWCAEMFGRFHIGFCKLVCPF